MASQSNRRNSNTQLLEELEALSQTLYQAPSTTTSRRPASLALPRTSVPAITSADNEIMAAAKVEDKSSSARPRSRRMSLSPWRSRAKLDDENYQRKDQGKVSNQLSIKSSAEKEKKGGIWNWKPIRALSHIGMQKLSCLFSVEVVTVQGLPASMNGLRLSVCIRKKETKDGAVHTMPSRVAQGAADFEETLFVKCHVYCNSSSGQGKQQLKFEPRPFWIYVFAIDAEELDFGRSSVDLSRLIQESMEKSVEGSRVRQWDMSFDLLGKAKGGELVLKLGFQIMEKDGGIDIYNAAEGLKSSKSKTFSSSFTRRQSKTSFSVPSPRMPTRGGEVWTPSKPGLKAQDCLQGIEDLNLDEPGPLPSSSSSIQKSEEQEAKMEDLDLPDFEVVDKGVEIQYKKESDEVVDKGVEILDKKETEKETKSSASGEVVKDIMHEDQVHLTRLSELDSIAKQIKALESMMAEEKIIKTDEETSSQRLDADEETVTREFLQMLEIEDSDKFQFPQPNIPSQQLKGTEDSTDVENKVYLSDLGKGLGPVVQTRDGGYLAAMNPLDTPVSRKDTPKLAMQISKPFVVASDQSTSGFELFQRMAAIGFEELSSRILSLMPMDELINKTAEQIAFEGVASAIIQGRNKEVASSTAAARTIAAVKTMATAMSKGRKERISTGIWNVNENSMTVEDTLAYSLQKIETMAVEALKIQAEMAEEDAPFDVSPLHGNTKEQIDPLASAVSLEDWIRNYGFRNFNGDTYETSAITIAVVVQLRDPIRRYEAVGGPIMAFIHAEHADDINVGKSDEERTFKVTSLHVAGLKVRKGGRKRSVWDGEKQRLTAMQWLLAFGLVKTGKRAKHVLIQGQDIFWSISSRVMADMWLKSMRNPDIKFSD